MNSSSVLVDWLLDSLELNTSLFHVGRYCGDWHASTHGLAQASFHLIVQGECWLHIDGDPRPQHLNNGDAVFLLRDFAFACPAKPRQPAPRSAHAAQCCPSIVRPPTVWD